MIPELRTDPMLRALAELPTGEPDASRAARIRGRCRDAITRRPRAIARVRRSGVRWRSVEPVVVAGLGLLYLSDVIRLALRGFGVL